MDKNLAGPFNSPHERLALALILIDVVEKCASVGQPVPPERGEREVLAHGICGLVALVGRELPLYYLNVSVERFNALDGGWSAIGEMGAIGNLEQGCETHVRRLDKRTSKEASDSTTQGLGVKM